MAKQIMVVERVGEIDLLQQALAGAADELIETATLEQQQQQTLDQTELLNILQGDSTDSQTIQLTAEQAVALGLRLEVDPCTEVENAEDDRSESSGVDVANDVIDAESSETLEIERNFNQPTTSIIINNVGQELSPIVTEVIKNITLNTNKPLGTSQNPIHLIQAEGVVKSIQELTPEQLSALQNSLQNHNSDTNVINFPNIQNVLYHPETKTRIVYRTVFPEDLDLQTPRRGRPPKRGRPKKPNDRAEEREASPDIPIAKPIRTRSGRVTKPPRHKHFRPLREIDIDNITENNESINEREEEDEIGNTTSNKNDPNTNTNETIEQISVEKTKTEETSEPVVFIELPQQKRRNISSQFRCPTCKKAYVGFNRMERHLRLFPDHGPLPIKRQAITLWETALKLARSAPPRSRGIALLNDLSLLIENVRKVAPAFIQPCDEKGPHYEINEALSVLLRIPVGKYTINDSELFSGILDTRAQQTSTEVHEIIHKPAENNLEVKRTDAESLQEQLLNVQIVPHTEQDSLILPVVDTGQVPMLVDTNGQSDELISVDQLVNERLHSLTATELPTPCNTASNPSLSLDLSIDLF